MDAKKVMGTNETTENAIYDNFILNANIRVMKDRDTVVGVTADEIVNVCLHKKISYTQMRAAMDVAREIISNLPISRP